MRRIVLASVSLFLVGLSAAACGDDDASAEATTTGTPAPTGTGGSGGSGGGTGGGGEAPLIPDLEEGWTEFNPGGDTICSRGDPYAYFVYKGSINKVIVDFIGGGACWDDFTCGLADAIFEDTVDSVREAVLDNEPHGFYDHANADNPFRDWYHVVIPYCTGDIHWGDAVTTYAEGMPSEVTINHKGAVNSRTVLDWVYDNFPAPEDVFVTGCSAGSYGSAMWAPHVMNHYTDARVTQFGDSGAGVITQEFFQDSFPSWNAQQAFPNFIPALDPAEVDILQMELADLYIGVGDYFSEQLISQYNTSFDENQHFYYQAMGGGTVEEWNQIMLASIARIEDDTTNFASFIPSGEQHCILPYDNFYTVEAGGVLLTDWLRGMVERQTLSSVTCTECTAPTP